MEYELDEQRSKADKAKHGIDFVESHALGTEMDQIEVPARPHDEPGTIVIQDAPRP